MERAARERWPQGLNPVDPWILILQCSALHSGCAHFRGPMRRQQSRCCFPRAQGHPSAEISAGCRADISPGEGDTFSLKQRGQRVLENTSCCVLGARGLSPALL